MHGPGRMASTMRTGLALPSIGGEGFRRFSAAEITEPSKNGADGIPEGSLPAVVIMAAETTETSEQEPQGVPGEE